MDGHPKVEASMTEQAPGGLLPLDRVEPGRTVEFVGFGEGLEAAFRDQLLAYGLQPRHPLKVLQQLPMTVVLCDHVELALESPVARLMRVRVPPGS